MSKNINKIILLAITIISLILLYYKNFIWLGSKWLNDPNYSHGPLIPFILIIYGIILTYYGKDIAKELLFPIAYLFFMVPFLGIFFLNRISNMLKLFSAYLSAKIIYLLGIPVFREGVILNFSTGSIEVADPCSGIRSILSLLALGIIFAYFTESSAFKKIVLVI